MRFMIIVKATKKTEAASAPDEGVDNPEKVMAEMAVYHEELANAGALLDASGLHPSSKGLDQGEIQSGGPRLGASFSQSGRRWD